MPDFEHARAIGIGHVVAVGIFLCRDIGIVGTTILIVRNTVGIPVIGQSRFAFVCNTTFTAQTVGILKAFVTVVIRKIAFLIAIAVVILGTLQLANVIEAEFIT